MIEADLALVGLSELVTPTGREPRLGEDLGRTQRIEEAAIAWRDREIVFVGTRDQFERQVQTKRILDGAGGTALPGFVDAHTHLPFAGWRESEFDERMRGASYSEIAARGGGILSTVRSTRAASIEDLTETCLERLDRMVRLGSTTVEAKSGYGLSHEDELKQLEAIRRAGERHVVDVIPTFLGAHTVPHEFRPDRRSAYLDLLIEQTLPEVVDRGLAAYADAFIDAHAFSLDEARRFLEAAAEQGLGLRLHVDQLADDGGSALAAALGAASADHLEFVSEDGIEALARAGTVAVLLPAVSLFLKMRRYAPARRLIEGGVPVALATDFNPGSCPTDSMGTVLWLACLTLEMTVDEAITAATLNAAASLGLADRTGSLEPGKRADIVVHQVPNRYHLVYRMGGHAIGPVIADGRVVVGEAC